MRSTRSLLLAATSLALATHVVGATRPRYGGSLEIQSLVTLPQFDPAQTDGNADTVRVRDRITRMVYDRLVEVDDNGRLKPGLAISWNHGRGERQWVFWIRPNVTVQDESPLSAADVAVSLHTAHPLWRTQVSGETVIVESDDGAANIPYELAAPESSIVIRRGDKLLGTGPFLLDGIQAGRLATLRAYDHCWSGRPFVDRVNLRLGQASREQLAYFEANGASIIEPDWDSRSPNLEGAGQFQSRATDLITVAFPPGGSDRDRALREAFSQARDRATLANVLLQHRAEPAYGLLPQWMSGYAKVLETSQNLAKARELAAASGRPTFTLAYEFNDPLAKIVAERVVLNAREGGIEVTLRPLSTGAVSGAGEARLVRLAMRSSNPVLALIDFARRLKREQQLPQKELGGEQQWFEAEKAVTEGFQVVPIVHVSRLVMIAPSLRNFSEAGNGEWRPETMWLDRTPATREGGR